MAGAIISTVQSLLKDVYLPPVNEQLVNEVFLLSRIEKVDDAEIVGNQVVVPLHTLRTAAIGARGELQALPASGNQGFARAVFDLSYHYGRIQVSGPSMAKTKNNIGSFLDVLKAEMDGVKNDLKKDLSRQVFGSSDGLSTQNGLLAQCGVTSASATVVLTSDEAIRKGHLYIGMRVDIGTTATLPAQSGMLVTSEAITALSVANKTITVTTAITTTTANYVARAGNPGKEVNGLQTLVSTAANTVGGIDASLAANFYWDNKRDTTGGALSLDKMQQMWNQLRIAGANTTLLLTTPGIQRQYFNLLQSQIRYVQPLEIKSGYNKEALAFNNKPLVEDIDGKFGSIFYLDESAIKHYGNKDWDWLAEDGDVLKWVIGFDAWEAALAKYFQLGITKRNTQGVQSGLTDATGY